MFGDQTENVESLFEICSTAVANHVAEAYDKMTASISDQDGKSDSNSSLVNPFDEWPLLLLEQVIGVLRMKRLLNVRHRDILINTKTRKLDFSSFCASENENMVVPFLQLAVVRCPKLTDLLFSNMRSHCTVEDYRKFLPHFTHLQVLDVSSNYSGFDDKCLEIVGIHCNYLWKLNLRYCHVTDVGIEWLCGGPREMIETNVPVGLNGPCKSLEELDITGTNVTAYGATMALQRLPHLKIFACERIVEAFSLMHPDDHLELAHPKFALTGLRFSWKSWDTLLLMPYQTRSLRVAIALCPLLTRLDIHIVEGITEVDLRGIVALERLSEFIVCNMCGDSCRITFDGSLAPILKVRGRSLNTLDLVHLSNTFICLATVIGYCPKLERLSLLNCKYLPTRLDQDLGISSSSKRVNSDLKLKRLKKLSLSHRCDIMAEVFLLNLISSPALEYLSIFDCSTLTDDVLQRVFQCNSFKNLEMLILLYCPNITSRGITPFLKNDNITTLIRFKN